MSAYGHKVGEQIECLSLAVELRKEQVTLMEIYRTQRS